jgi:hypothetical protein
MVISDLAANGGSADECLSELKSLLAHATAMWLQWTTYNWESAASSPLADSSTDIGKVLNACWCLGGYELSASFRTVYGRKRTVGTVQVSNTEDVRSAAHRGARESRAKQSRLALLKARNGRSQGGSCGGEGNEQG